MPDFGVAPPSDLQFLREKEKQGNLIHEISAEFNTNADQITYTPASGKTFFLIKAKLYPVVDTVVMDFDGSGIARRNRRADVEITFDGTVIDVLTHDFESINEGGAGEGPGSASNAGQYESNMMQSLVGDGIKSVKLTSTGTSGTYRVSLLGWIEDT